MTDWLAERSSRFTALLSERLEAWEGIEMALRESVARNGAQFSASDAPCLQLFELQARLSTDTALRLGTYQDNDVFDLYYDQESKFRDVESWDGILRWRNSPQAS
ncbi:hypothetical protein [Amycolatopsis sp. BJA-103]|uniref:hypothetical protein n=1 Tax=Amycolatopsis sp. BJA-103 TaxID=1911175 RepID=UPI0011AF2880|nr:hypothetical protein [Amycolatopsis sp. BJA-103]